MAKKYDFGWIPIIVILVGVYFIIDNEYVYKYEKYYLGDSLTTKHIMVDKVPEFVKGSLFRAAHYNFTSTQFKARCRISDGALEALIKNKTVSEITSLKKGDTLTIKFRSTDNGSLSDSTSKVRIMDLSRNNAQLIDAEEVEKFDKKNYNLNIRIGILLLLVGVLWQVWRGAKKRSKSPHS